ncbi:MAG: hypothetical protein AAF515_15625 [Pseudomonadota bacterium]
MSARIHSARVIAAHDGVAELAVTMIYDNGGTTEVTLDAMASQALMASCAADTLSDLNGHDWRKVRDALSLSYNRFSGGTHA